MKRVKYSNGSSVVRKEFPGVGSLELGASGTGASVTANRTTPRYSATHSRGFDARGNRSVNSSLEVQLPKSAVVFKRNKQSDTAEWNKRTQKDTHIRISGSKSRQTGLWSAEMKITKPL